MTTIPFSGTQSGTFVGGSGASDTFTRSVTNTAGVRTATATFTLPNGSTVSRSSVTTQTATGWTRDVTTTLANGKTETLQEVGTKQTDGSTAITGSFQKGRRWTENVSGTATDGASGATTDLTFSNPWGSTRTRDTTLTHTGDQRTGTASGTTYGGANFSTTGALTILQSQSS